MIKYFMRKTIYKKFDKESQDMLFQLTSKQYILKFLCYMFWVAFFIFPFIPLFIIDVCEDIEFSMTTQIAILAFMLIFFIGLFISIKEFKIAMFTFSQMLAERIYFLVCTAKGKALCKEDFDAIKQADENLYELITMQMCRGFCYSICFEICKILKKGSIEFLAIKDIPSYDYKDEQDFTMHVLYVNNGWAFDTFNCCQYPIEKLHKIYKAKVYKTFSFEDISNKSYKDFREEQEPKLLEWSNNNDCSMFWKCD